MHDSLVLGGGGGGLLLSPYKGDFTWHRISGSSMVNTCML